MTKWIKVLAVLCMWMALPTGCLAQEYYRVSDVYKQVQEKWKAEYKDSQGRVIPVDVNAEVYGNGTLSVSKVEIADYKLDETLFQSETEWNDRRGAIILHHNPADYIFREKKGEMPLIVYRSYGERIDLNKIYGNEYGEKYTVQDMIDCAQNILIPQGIEADSYLFEQPFDFSVRCRVKKDSLEVTEQAIYLSHFWQTIDGVPILEHANRAFYKTGWPDFFPQLVLGMREKDEYQITVNAVKKVDEIAGDIPLCSFDEIKRSISKLIEQGHIRKIYDIRLGYVLYNDPNYPQGKRDAYEAECYYLVPTWCVNCIYMENPKEEYVYKGKQEDEMNEDEKNTPEYRMVMIDAQSGVVLDPFDRSKNGHGNADYKGVLTWDDVQ